MKKIFFFASALSILITQTGCFGSFALTKKIWEFNDSVDSKVLKTLLFYVLNIIPVYGVGVTLDFWIFNLIEFWSGDNPLSMAPGESQEQLMTLKGETYKVTATQNKMEFVKLVNGEEIDMGAMEFTPENLAWNFVKDGESQKLASFNTETNSADFFGTDGIIATVDAQTIECLAMDRVNTSNTVAFASK